MKRSMFPAGVTEVAYRQALEETRRKASCDASALQADMARRLNLPGAGGNNGSIVRRQQQRPAQCKQETKHQGSKQQESKVQEQQQQPPVSCQSCTALNAAEASVCGVCGYYLAGVRQPVATLAQRRGLVQAAPKVETVSPAAWATIESRVDDRKDAFCPICMEAFKTGHEVLLSCSHMFHRHCLHAFEQFMGRETRSCPICRSVNYQKKITQRGSKAFEVVCAIRLQAFSRGFLSRRAYHVWLHTFYQANKGKGTHDSRQRKRFYERELSTHADRIAKEVDARGGLIDSVIQSMDHTLEESRQLDALFADMVQQRQAQRQLWGGGHDSLEDSPEELYPESFSGAPASCEAKSNSQHAPHTEQQWQEACAQAKLRGHVECSICTETTDSAKRGLILLSCSHLLHSQCLANMERFLAKGVRGACCICRTIYGKRPITQAFDLL